MLSSLRYCEQERLHARRQLKDRVAASLANHAGVGHGTFDDGTVPSLALACNILRGLRPRTDPAVSPPPDQANMLSEPVVPETSYRENPRAMRRNKDGEAGPSPMSDADETFLSPNSVVAAPSGGDFPKAETFESPSPAASPRVAHTLNETHAVENGGGGDDFPCAPQVTMIDGVPGGGSGGVAPDQTTMSFRTQWLPSTLMGIAENQASRSRYADDSMHEDDEDGVEEHCDADQQRGDAHTGEQPQRAAVSHRFDDDHQQRNEMLHNRRTAVGQSTLPALSSIMAVTRDTYNDGDGNADSSVGPASGGRLGLLSPPAGVDHHPEGPRHDDQPWKATTADAATEIERYTRLAARGYPSAGNVPSALPQVQHALNQIESQAHRLVTRDLAIHRGEPPNNKRAAEEQHDLKELSLHLYSLKQQVMMLSHLTSVALAPSSSSQVAHGGAANGAALHADLGASITQRTTRGSRTRGSGAGPVTVHVVRDYDAPIVAYKKSHQQPLAKPPMAAMGGGRAAFPASSGQYSSDFTTANGSSVNNMMLPTSARAARGGPYVSASIAEDSLVMASSSWDGAS